MDPADTRNPARIFAQCGDIRRYKLGFPCIVRCCPLGLAQLERVDELVARKREIFARYSEELAGLSGVTLNHEGPSTQNSYWMVTAVLDPARGIRKEQLIAELGAQGIDTRPFFYPLSSLEAYKDHPEARVARTRNSVAYALSPYGINLPSGLHLSPEMISRVCHAFRGILTDASKE